MCGGGGYSVYCRNSGEDMSTISVAMFIHVDCRGCVNYCNSLVLSELSRVW